MKAKIALRILYKSGNHIDVKCSDWAVEWNRATQEITSLRIDNSEPRAGFYGLDSIEAIWRL